MITIPSLGRIEKVLEEVASVSGVFNNSDDFLLAETRLIYQKL